MTATPGTARIIQQPKETTMSKPLAILLAAALLSATSALAQTAPTTARNANAQWSEEGLEPINVRGLDVVFAKPGATLAGYERIELTPISVEFRRNWERQAAGTGTRARVRPADVQRIRDRLSQLVETTVVEELAAGGFEMADGPGEDVLTVQMSIVNLNINAPDLPSSGNVRVYTTSVGEMTLVAELRDSSSGELIMRILDRRVGRDTLQPQFTTRVNNVSEARQAARAWAQALRRGLESARALGEPVSAGG
jgi:hypothetical protein